MFPGVGASGVSQVECFESGTLHSGRHLVDWGAECRLRPSGLGIQAHSPSQKVLRGSRGVGGEQAGRVGGSPALRARLARDGGIYFLVQGSSRTKHPRLPTSSDPAQLSRRIVPYRYRYLR